MSYMAKVFNVMIASPSDVANERRMARDIIVAWNYIHSMKKRTVLMPSGWESHAAPEMGDRAQEIINQQVLQDADLLVGIFWTRVGTPTGNSESGTIEEIEKHIEKGRPVMLYFSNTPIQPNLVNQEQYNKLLEFKESFKKRGLIETFESISEFSEKFSKQLQITIINNKYFEVGSESVDGQVDVIVEADSDPLEDIKGALTSEEKVLLIEASKDRSGNILKMRFIGQALVINTNSKAFAGTSDPRNNAMWEEVIDRLQKFGLIDDVGYKGEIFKITHLGYQVADLLSKESI